jgi:hypothetical protein
MRHSIKRYKKINKKTKRRHRISKMKYKCVKLRSKTKKYRGGATSIPPTATLPMIIDKNNVMYTCTPMPTS